MALNTEALNRSEFSRPVQRVALFDRFDYALQALDRLPNQYFNSIKLQALLFQATDPYNDVELIANDLQRNRWVDTAIGKQLDGVGHIVGEARQGREDELYREAIKFRIFVNTSNATPDDLIRGLLFLTRPDDAQYMEAYPATAMLFTDGAFIPRNIKEVIQGLSPAAITDVPVMVSYAGVKPFRFGQTEELAELFVENDQNYLTAEGHDLQVSVSAVGKGTSTFGGLVPANFAVSVGGIDYELSLGGYDESLLAVNSPEHNSMLESGYHLTGVF